MNETELLFSYGTLQDEQVQIETFGRTLKGYNDTLLDYELAQVEIKDTAVVKLSGKTHHPMAVKSAGNQVHGVVFEITPAELARSDKYEVDDYQRIIGNFKSGKQAWVYVQAV